MKANDLYIFLEAEFGKVFKPDTRSDGRAYYWHEIKRGPASTRLLRITESATGDVAEIKLPRSSIAAGRDIFVPLPASPAQVAVGVRGELSQLLAK